MGHKARVVMGIDPSINFTGYAFITDGYLDSFNLINIKKDTHNGSDVDKLQYLSRRIQYVCELWIPDVVVVEDYQWRASNARLRNKDHMKKLIWAIGVCVCSVPEGIKVALVKPHDWKGTKQKVDTLVECQEIFGVQDGINDNCADAIMMAWHHWNQMEDI